MSDLFFVSVIIPCRNEEKLIGKCLKSIIANDSPKERLEVWVVDGMSEDKTRKIVEGYAQQYPFIRLLDNPKKITPVALNIGINNAKGDVIMIMSAHAEYPNDYISKCVYYSNKLIADNVGGVLKTFPGDNTLTAKAISFVLSYPFGVGNSRFRIGANVSMLVDTVPFGCYRKEVFEKIGLFNEDLERNQDIDLNLRLKRMGGKIILFPDIVSYYYSRSTLKALAKNSFWNGFWVIYSTKFAKSPFSWRHLIPLIFATSLLFSLLLSFLLKSFLYLFFLILVSYSLANFFFSFRVAQKNGFKYFLPTILAFFTLHLMYGLGSLSGLIKLATSKKLRNN